MKSKTKLGLLKLELKPRMELEIKSRTKLGLEQNKLGFNQNQD